MSSRLSGLVALAVCRHLGLRSQALDRVCSELYRPTFGHWVALLRTCAGLLHENKDELLRPLVEALFAKVPKGSAIEALGAVLRRGEGRAPATTIEVLEAAVRFRNALRHGVAAEAAPPEKEDAALVEGILALWEAAPPAGGLRVLHVARVEQSAAGATADVLAMHGSAPQASRIAVRGATDGLAGTLQLLREPSTWIRLSPLAAAEEGPGGWHVGWLAGSVLAPSFKYQSDAREFQAGTTQAEYEEILGLARGAEIDAALQERLRLDPYRGLLAYEEIDNPVFFGREEETARALATLAERGAVVIAGASGSGKSSLMRAGVVPALRRKSEDEPREALLLVVVPGKRPLEALREAVLAAGPEGAAEAASWSRSVQELLPAPGSGPADGLVHLVRGLAGRTKRPVLCVDQLEEVSTAGASADEGRAFLDAIVSAAGAGIPVVVTVRSDLIAPLLEHEGFRALHDRAVLSIGGLSAAQLDRIIREPLRGRHVEIEDGLPEAIVREVEGRPGALALLSQVLTTLWEERGAFGGRLTKAGYEAAGGVRGCVAAQASKARDEVPEAARARLDALLLQLVSRGEQNTFVRRRVALEDAAQVLEAPVHELRSLLAPFVARRLVVLSRAVSGVGAPGTQTAEVAHEALITGWPHLRNLAASQADVLDLRRRVEDGARAWEAAGRRREFWNDDHSNLRRAEELAASGRLALAPPQRAFLEASRARVRARGRLQKAMMAGLAVLLAAAVFGFVRADKARRDADEAANVAKAATVAANAATDDAKGANRELEKQKRLSLAEVISMRSGNNRQRLAHAIAALRLDPDRDASTWESASTSMIQGFTCRWVSPMAAMTSGPVVTLALVDDGRSIVAGDSAGGIAVYPLGLGKPTRESAVWGSPSFMAFSPDGSLVATGGRDRSVRTWSSDSGTGHDVFQGHEAVVTCGCFSPDGRTLATGGVDKTIRLWETGSTSERATLKGHDAPITSLAYSPDGSRILSAATDATVRFWDAASGRPVGAPIAYPGTVSSVAWSVDGRLVATGGENGETRVWEASGSPGTPIAKQDGAVGAVAFTPDAAIVVSGSDDGTTLVTDRVTGHVVKKLGGHTSGVRALVVSKDGDLVFTGSYDRTIRSWRRSTGETQGSVPGHTAGVRSVALSPDAAKAVSGGEDDTARIWDVETGAQDKVLVGHRGIVTVVAWGGGAVASGSTDKTVRIWNPVTGEQVHVLTHEAPVTSLAFTPDGKRLASASMDGRIGIWNASTWTLHRLLEPQRGAQRATPITSIAFSADGQLLASGGVDRILRVWDAASFEQVNAFEHPYVVGVVGFDASGSVLGSGGQRDLISVYDPRTREPRGTFSGSTSFVTAIARSASGLIGWASRDSVLRIYDRRTSYQWAITGHNDSIEAMAFSNDGSKMITGSLDSTVRVWRATEDLRELGRRHPGAEVAAWSADGQVLATAQFVERDDRGREPGPDEPDQFDVAVWSVKRGAEVWRLESFTDRVSVMALSPDGSRLAIAFEESRVIRVYDTATRTAMRELEGHTGRITELAFDQSASRLISGADEPAVRVWDLEAESELCKLEHKSARVTGVAFLDGLDSMCIVRLDDWSTHVWALKGAPHVDPMLVEDGPFRVNELKSDRSDEARRLNALITPRFFGMSLLLPQHAEWYAAWRAQRAWKGAGLSPQLAAVLERAEKLNGLRFDPDSRLFERVPQPGPAYANTGFAELCK
jgi:WD40 repeat protein